MNIDRPDWQQKARCRNVPTEVFFPEAGDNYIAARKVCARCEVQEECLEWAMELEATAGRAERHGMYGCCTPAERYKYRRRTSVCEVCGEVFKMVRVTQKLCGDIGCWNIHRAEYMNEWRASA